MIKTIEDFNLKNKAVLLRVDLNVPLDDSLSISDDTRIQEALPTIKYCVEQGARLVLCSHLGRPKGKAQKKFSLEPVAARLAELLEKEVMLLADKLDDGLHQIVHHGKDDAVLLLENLRFHPGEEENEEKFTRALASLADIYISDAFGTAHRKHASTYGVPELVNDKGVGYLIQKELKFLQKLVESPKHPFVLVVGGAKVTDKLKAVENLLNHVDTVIVGGAMAYAFLAAQGKSIGKSKCEEAGIAAAKSILQQAEQKRVNMVLPVDHVVAYPEKDSDLLHSEILDSVDVPDNAAALDIGPKTVELFQEKICEAKTIFWNGPMGFFEKDKYSEGTKKVAAAIEAADALKVGGGGDTISAVKKLSNAEKFDLLSTGGGASLKYLEGNGLAGINVLDIKAAGAKTSGDIDMERE